MEDMEDMEDMEHQPLHLFIQVWLNPQHRILALLQEVHICLDTLHPICLLNLLLLTVCHLLLLVILEEVDTTLLDTEYNKEFK